jgi:hypothetical protein
MSVINTNTIEMNTYSSWCYIMSGSFSPIRKFIQYLLILNMASYMNPWINEQTNSRLFNSQANTRGYRKVSVLVRDWNKQPDVSEKQTLLTTGISQTDVENMNQLRQSTRSLRLICPPTLYCPIRLRRSVLLKGNVVLSNSVSQLITLPCSLRRMSATAWLLGMWVWILMVHVCFYRMFVVCFFMFCWPCISMRFWVMTNLMHSFLMYLFYASTCFEQQVLIIRRAKLY